ncbi:MAG: ComEA family DNA-binding protein [Chloroflexi bacterium]|jgi:competence protein ComEA|nr:MAG: ComEA family DNA-binding protein [Chloroflexota bacterium]
MQIGRFSVPPRILLIAVSALLFVAALTVTLTDTTQAVEIVEQPVVTSEPPRASGQNMIRVEVSGGVTQPGVISLPEGSRLIDAVSAAGGWGERVDPLRVELCLNLAAPLEDGGAIRIPTRDDRLLLGLTGVECGPLYSSASEIASSGATNSASGSSATGGKIDLNRASAEELDTLPGIGPATAAKIIAARKEKPFVIVEDLRDLKIISESVLQGIRALVIP